MNIESFRGVNIQCVLTCSFRAQNHVQHVKLRRNPAPTETRSHPTVVSESILDSQVDPVRAIIGLLLALFLVNLLISENGSVSCDSPY